MKNKFEIGYLSVFHLFSHGINVFLCVGSDDDENSLYVYELETLPTNDEYEKIAYNLINKSFIGKAPEDRLFIEKETNNSFFVKH